MELSQLNYFLEVARNQSVTKAASVLNISQPSISQAIQRLENELGVPLFNRTGKRIVLNDYGQIYLNAVQDVFSRLDKANEELNILNMTKDHPLTVAVWNYSSLCSRILIAFLEKYPTVNISVLQDSMSIVHDNSEDYDLGLIVVTNDLPSPKNNEVVFEEKFLLAVNKNHPLAQYDSIPLIMAKDEPFIMMTAGSPMRTATEGFCHLAGFSPVIKYENNDSDTLRRMVQLGIGIALYPQYTSGVIEVDNIKTIRIETPLCQRTINVCWPEGKELSPSALLLKDFIKQFFKDNF